MQIFVNLFFRKIKLPAETECVIYQIKFPYIRLNTHLHSVNSIRGLRVTIDLSLSFSDRITRAICREKRVLGFLGF